MRRKVHQPLKLNEDGVFDDNFIKYSIPYLIYVGKVIQYCLELLLFLLERCACTFITTYMSQYIPFTAEYEFEEEANSCFFLLRLLSSHHEIGFLSTATEFTERDNCPNNARLRGTGSE